MLSDYPEFLTVLAAVALILIFVFRHQLEISSIPQQLIFGSICGGIAGNLTDRIFRNPAEVVDFIDVYLPALNMIIQFSMLRIRGYLWVPSIISFGLSLILGIRAKRVAKTIKFWSGDKLVYSTFIACSLSFSTSTFLPRLFVREKLI